jgi:glycosyltransferase involved in cell wall biosynthesis
MKSHRLAHLITTIERGGAENAVSILVGGQVKSGHEVTVIPLKGKLELLTQLDKLGAKVDLSLHGKGFIHQIIIAFKLLGKFQFIHAHLPRSEILARITCARKTFFVTRHNSESFYPTAPRLLSGVLSRFVTAKASGVIAISETVKRFLIQEQEVRDEKTVKVIYYGYPHGQYVSDLRPFLNTQAIRLGTISRLEVQKNLPFMFFVVKELNVQSKSTQLQIIGVGSQEDPLKDLVIELGMQDKISFLGKTSNVLNFIASNQIFLMTSHYEGFCMSLLEAMDAGAVIVAPNHSAFPEVLGSDHPGLYEPNDLIDCVSKVLLFVKDSELSRDVVLAQRQRLSLYSVDRYVFAYNNLYLPYHDVL